MSFLPCSSQPAKAVNATSHGSHLKVTGDRVTQLIQHWALVICQYPLEYHNEDREKGRTMLIAKWDWYFYVSMKHLDPVSVTSGKKVQLFFSACVKSEVPKIAQNQTEKANNKSKLGENKTLEQFYCLPINYSLLNNIYIYYIRYSILWSHKYGLVKPMSFMTICGSKNEPLFLFIKRTWRKLTLNVLNISSKLYALPSVGFL